MRPVLALCALLTAAGCHTVRPTTAPTAREHVLFEAARQAWLEAGRADVESCILLHPDRVWFVYGSQEDVTRWCRRPETSPVLACTYLGRTTIADRLHVELVVSTHTDRGEVPARTVASLTIHEWLHTWRGCWVQEAPPEDYLARYRAGREHDPACSGRTMQDAQHCDVELWTTIERRALEIWSGS